MPQYQGVWTLEQQAQAQSNQQWVTDPNFKNTTLLLQADGTGSGSQNQTFLDGSTNNFFITRNGNTTQGSFSPFSQAPGYWGNYFDGSTAYLTTPTSAALAYGSGDFTFELFSYTTSNASANSRLLGNWGGSWSANFWSLHSNHSSYVNKYSFFVYNYSVGSAMLVSTSTVPLNQWVHIAITRSGNTWRMFINGVLDVSQTSSVSIDGGSTDDMFIGGTGQAGEYSNGYISNTRIVKGTALYTANFTPQTSPLTAVTNTSLLTCQSNRFVDNSTNAFAITTNGSPSVQAFGPFAPALQWTPDVVGGSGYFDETGDYLSVGSGTDFDFGISDFSIEFWYWIPSIGTYATGLACKRQGGVATGWLMSTGGFSCLSGGTWYDSWGNPYWVGSSASTGFNASSSTTKIGQWTHVMVTRQGTDARWFVNGQLIGYQSRSSAIDQLTGSLLSIGLGGINYENPFLGYISNGRISIGSVPTGYQTSSTTLNTQVFTPPTSPVTTTSQGATSGNVKYIGNFTNAGIYDGKMANNLETVASAQVATSPVKYGSGSMYFNGTSDFLRIPNTQAFNFGSGNFTIEFWAFVTSMASEGCVFHNVDADPNGVLVSVNAVTGKWRFYAGAGGSWFVTLDSSVLITAGTWNHVACTRNGSTWTLWLNGVNTASATSSSNPSMDSNPAIIGRFTSSTANYFNGYLDDFRITTGVCRYFTTFTPPQQALPRQ